MGSGPLQVLGAPVRRGLFPSVSPPVVDPARFPAGAGTKWDPPNGFG
jgi:hypothetical protein